jgi:hypothetical protein
MLYVKSKDSISKSYLKLSEYIKEMGNVTTKVGWGGGGRGEIVAIRKRSGLQKSIVCTKMYDKMKLIEGF